MRNTRLFEAAHVNITVAVDIFRLGRTDDAVNNFLNDLGQLVASILRGDRPLGVRGRP